MRDGVRRRSMQFVDKDNNIYSIFRPLSASVQPELGRYYGLSNVEIAKTTDDPKWGKQNQLKSPDDGDIQIIDATKWARFL